VRPDACAFPISPLLHRAGPPRAEKDYSVRIQHADSELSMVSALSPVARAVRGLLRSRKTREQRESAAQHARSRKAEAASRMRLEPLEPRVLMAADPVVVMGSIDAPGQTNTYSFTLDTATHLVFDSLTTIRTFAGRSPGRTARRSPIAA
jgi:hypothetical protein